RPPRSGDLVGPGRVPALGQGADEPHGARTGDARPGHAHPGPHRRPLQPAVTDRGRSPATAGGAPAAGERPVAGVRPLGGRRYPRTHPAAALPLGVRPPGLTDRHPRPPAAALAIAPHALGTGHRKTATRRNTPETETGLTGSYRPRGPTGEGGPDAIPAVAPGIRATDCCREPAASDDARRRVRRSGRCSRAA